MDFERVTKAAEAKRCGFKLSESQLSRIGSVLPSDSFDCAPERGNSMQKREPILVTANKREFGMVKGLIVEDWTL